MMNFSWLSTEVAAAWAQALLSGAAIAFSGFFAVWVPRQERKAQRERESRSRFDVTTTRFEPAGLRLDISYRPEFNHVGIYARVTLLSPPDAQLMAMRMATNPAPINGRHVRHEPDGVCLDGIGYARLVQFDNEDALSGVLLLLPPMTSNSPLAKARLRFEIWTDSKALLLSDELEVSPIDEARSFWDYS